MSSLPAAILDALEDHDAEHNDEADPNHDGEGEQVGVDVKRGVLRYSEQITFFYSKSN